MKRFFWFFQYRLGTYYSGRAACRWPKGRAAFPRRWWNSLEDQKKEDEKITGRAHLQVQYHQTADYSLFLTPWSSSSAVTLFIDFPRLFPESLAAIKAYPNSGIGTFGHHGELFYKRSYESSKGRQCNWWALAQLLSNDLKFGLDIWLWILPRSLLTARAWNSKLQEVSLGAYRMYCLTEVFYLT